MTKLKKLLLTLAPISAVMIATPIILTSCSTNAEQNNGGGTGNGTGGGSNSGGGSDTGGSGGSGGGTTTNPSLTADATNSKDFAPTTDKGLFKTIEETIKAGAPGKEKDQTEKAITDYTTLKKEDVKDAIDVWSFNKWVGVTNSKVKYTSSIDKFVADKKETARAKTTWDVSFTYKFKVVTTYEANKIEDIYAERTFEAKGVDLAGVKGVVDFTTKASLFMVDGNNMLKDTQKLYDSKADANETQTIKDVRTFLNSANSKFDIRQVANDFVTAKGFKGEVTVKNPIWDETKVKADTSLTFDVANPTEVSMILSSKGDPKWGNCTSETEYNAIINTLDKNKTYKDKIKSLITTNDYDIGTMDFGPEQKGETSSNMDITINFTKKTSVAGDDAKPKLIFKVKGFKKSA